MFILRSDGTWNHAPTRKVIINPILRKLQWWTDRPYVIGSICEWNEYGRPVFVKYAFQRVKYMK